MPVTYQTLQEADQGKGYQLYAGRPAFSGAVKPTDGNEPPPKDWREEENEKYRKELAEKERGKT
jgi:cytochrome c oxidase assembly factor 5